MLSLKNVKITLKLIKSILNFIKAYDYLVINSGKYNYIS